MEDGDFELHVVVDRVDQVVVLSWLHFLQLSFLLHPLFKRQV
jgi:hypothetical protein